MAVIVAVSILVLSIFLGFELISKVPPTLHTPLMSGCNAISGITLVGAVLSAGESGQALLFQVAGIGFSMTTLLGFLAVIFAT
ncbi:MAG: NAD(P) transhydrogenase subunit alpha, partial [Leptospiraceae bacterium]|nr:NAD(P) transhydrogenase subunit alpha [Leptospiraceae bacterium]